MSPTPSSCALALPRNLLSDIKAWPFLLSVQAGMSMGELSSCQEHNMRACLEIPYMYIAFCLVDRGPFDSVQASVENHLHLTQHSQD